MPLNVQKVKWGHMLRPASPALPGSPPKERPASADDVFAAWVLGPAAKVPTRATRSGLQAVLFDLDGVLVDTADLHYRAWKRLADELHIHFNHEINHGFRGVGRMECLQKLLGEHARFFAPEELTMLADRKNGYYLESL